jgi:DNA segregation ATPase FtsK/SpoIIIE-like protein
MSKYILRKKGNAGAVFENLKLEARELFKNSDVSITVESYKKSRSNSQNAYYWSLIGILANFTGFDKQDLSEFMVIECGFTRISKVFDSEQVKARSTTTLTVSEFSELINKVIEYLLSNQLSYPQPSYYGFDLNG